MMQVIPKLPYKVQQVGFYRLHLATPRFVKRSSWHPCPVNDRLNVHSVQSTIRVLPSHQAVSPTSLQHLPPRYMSPMRFRPFVSTLLHTLSNFTRIRAPASPAHIATLRPLPLRSMSGIPFLGALFGSSSSKSTKMSYPDQRSDTEWQAVLNKGTVMSARERKRKIFGFPTNISPQSNFASCEKRALSLLDPESSTSITRKRESTLVLGATSPSTRPITNSSLAADGRPTLTASLAQLQDTRIEL